MPLLDRLFGKHEGRAIGPSQAAWDRGDYPEGYFEPVGVRVDRDAALGVSAVWACVSLIADTIATLPLGLFETANNAPKQLPAQAWMNNPNPEQSLVEFMFGVVTSLLLHGNAYIYTVRDKFQNVIEVWVLDPRWVYARRELYGPNNDTRVVYYIQVAKGMQSPVGPQIVPAGPDMFHITAFQPSSSWPMGISPLDNARMLWGSAIAGQEMGARWFGRGFNAAGVLETDDDVTDEQALQIKRSFADMNTGGPRKMHLPPLLTGGLKWQSIQITPEQAQFLGQRQFAVDEVARWFRVPPHMIGNLEKTSSWGAGIEQQSIGFVKYTLRGWINRIEASLKLHMLPFQPDAFFRFDTLDLMRGDMASLADFGLKTHMFGGMSANEFRSDYLGKPSFEGGDVHYFPVNTAPVGTEPIRVDKPVVELPGANLPPADQVVGGEPVTGNQAADDGSRSLNLHFPAPIVNVEVPAQPAPEVRVEGPRR